MLDKKTTIQELKDVVLEFRDKRDWAKFHDAKNLAEAISIEAGELQENFLWKNSKEITKRLNEDRSFRKKVGEELADVFIFCINFANATGMDIANVVKNKIDSNNKKYPVEKSRGNAKKYDQLT